MSSIDILRKELDDIEQKLDSARKAAAALDATEREKIGPHADRTAVRGPAAGAAAPRGQ